MPLTPLLDERNLRILEELVSEKTMFAFDFDGTLAPIVANRDAAVMRESTHSALAAFCELRRCSVITGRSCSDAEPRLRGVRLFRLIGNHGLEGLAEQPDQSHGIAQVSDYLRGALSDLEGVELEDKGLSLAIHFRKSPQPERALAAIHSIVEEAPIPMRSIGGKAVVNLVPQGAPNKGVALAQLVREAGAERALYVGDDETDEDVFGLKDADWLVGVRVGRSSLSQANYFLPSQLAIDQLLQALLSLAHLHVERRTV